MDLNHLSVFVTVAELGSFTAAASRLGMPKSTVSRAVAALEASLRVRLVQRTSRSVALTTAGRALFDRVGPRLEALTEAVEGLPEIGEEPSGVLRITAIADYGTEVLSEVIASFSRRYPRVGIDMHLSTRAVDLVKEGFDVAFRFMGKKPRDSNLVVRKIGELTLHFYAAPSYLAARGAPKTPDELEAHDCVTIKGTGPLTLEGPSKSRVRLRSKLTADDGFFIREAVRRGMGIGMLATFLAREDVLSGRLVRVLPRWALTSGTVYLVFPSVANLPRKTAAFRDHVIESMRARDARTAARAG